MWGYLSNTLFSATAENFAVICHVGLILKLDSSDYIFVATSSCRGHVDELATEPFLLLHREHGTGYQWS